MDRSLLMQMVAGRSPAAQRGALNALRAIAVDSPVVAHRVARVATTALQDSSADWSPDERTALATAAAGATPSDTDPHRDRLSDIVRESGLTDTEFARAIGVDSGTLARWLSNRQAIPGSRADWIDRLVRADVTRDRITLVLAR